MYGFYVTRNFKNAKLEFGFITIQNIFNITGTKIYDVYIAHRKYIQQLFLETEWALSQQPMRPKAEWAIDSEAMRARLRGY